MEFNKIFKVTFKEPLDDIVNVDFPLGHFQSNSSLLNYGQTCPAVMLVCGRAGCWRGWVSKRELDFRAGPVRWGLD